jgi:hypothetical protein
MNAVEMASCGMMICLTGFMKIVVLEMGLFMCVVHSFMIEVTLDWTLGS